MLGSQAINRVNLISSAIEFDKPSDQLVDFCFAVWFWFICKLASKWKFRFTALQAYPFAVVWLSCGFQVKCIIEIKQILFNYFHRFFFFLFHSFKSICSIVPIIYNKINKINDQKNFFELIKLIMWLINPVSTKNTSNLNQMKSG